MTSVSKTKSAKGVPFDFVVYERDPAGIRMDMKAPTGSEEEKAPL